jgi:hypothetical protein
LDLSGWIEQAIEFTLHRSQSRAAKQRQDRGQPLAEPDRLNPMPALPEAVSNRDVSA